MGEDHIGLRLHSYAGRQEFMLVVAAAAATHMNCSASHAYLTVPVHLTRCVLVAALLE